MVDQGHGIEGRFGGLTDEYSQYEISEIALLPIPYDKTTTYQHGTDKGPAALIEASRNLELYDIETDSEVYRRGICTLPAIEANHPEELNRKTVDVVLQALTQGKFVATIGGEHTVSYGAIKAHYDFFPSISILQLDAHADLQNTYEGDRWSHACVMARVLELPKIHKLVSVGVRSMSIEEKPRLSSILPFFAHELMDSDQWMQEVIDNLSERVYLTLDLDVFDSSIMPSTGTPEPGGLNWTQVTQLLKLLIQQKELVGFDIVELSPRPDNPAPDFLAAKLLYKILSYHFKWKNNEH